MGQRGNYIIKSRGKVDIFYTHWRANLIVNDLLLGPSKYIDFVKQFDKTDELINEPWIEGCVLVNMESKRLLFWEIEQLFEFTLREKYLNKLKKIWKEWKIEFLEKEMYDIENILKIDYTSIQKKSFTKIKIEEIINNTVHDYVSCLVIFKRQNKIDLKKIYTGSDEQLSLLGKQIISVLENKPSSKLIKESDIEVSNIILIDCDNNLLFINQNITGLKDELIDLWTGWQIEVGNFGYINLLKKIGHDTTSLQMNENEILERIKDISNYKDDFDPLKVAKRITETDEDIKFYPNFFENIKPKKTIWERIRIKF